MVGDLVIDRDAIRVERLELGATGTSVTLSGTLMQFENPRYDLALNADFDVEQLAVLAGLPEPAGGAVRAEVTARGPLEALIAEAHIRGTDLSFRNLEGIQLVADTSYDRVAQQARFARLAIAAPVGNIEAQGVVSSESCVGHESA